MTASRDCPRVLAHSHEVFSTVKMEHAAQPADVMRSLLLTASSALILCCHSSGPGQGGQGNNSGRLTSHRLNSCERVAPGKLAGRGIGSGGSNPLNWPLRVGSRAYFRLREGPGSKSRGRPRNEDARSTPVGPDELPDPNLDSTVGAQGPSVPGRVQFWGFFFSLLVSKFHNG